MRDDRFISRVLNICLSVRRPTLYILFVFPLPIHFFKFRLVVSLLFYFPSVTFLWNSANLKSYLVASGTVRSHILPSVVGWGLVFKNSSKNPLYAEFVQRIDSALYI